MQVYEEKEMKISEFFEMVQKEGGTYEIETDNGYKPLGDLVIKKNMDGVLIRTEDGDIECSTNHLFMTKNGWKLSDKLSLSNDKIKKRDKFVSILCKEYLGKIDTYDFEVLTEEHSYLANGFVSHNTSKTACIKQLTKIPVEYKGKKYDGIKIVDIPLAQIEELGDVLGLPETFVELEKDGNKKWVMKDFIENMMKHDWTPTEKSPVTKYAKPSWVPEEECPGIILFDDGNRASQRIMKGLMQLVQDYKTISWELPKGWTIVFTGNPDNRWNQVTSMDTAQLTRMKHVTMEIDAKEWAKWATENDLDARGINFILKYPEMMIGKERTNPRTLAEFFYMLKKYPQKLSQDDRLSVYRDASSLLDEETVDVMMTFFLRDVELVIDPEMILNDNAKALKELEKLMKGSEPRIDIVNVVNDRLVAYLSADNYEFKQEHVKGVQNWMLDKNLPKDVAYGFIRNILLGGCKYGKKFVSNNIDILKMVESTYKYKG